jgi:hypothetical protein
MYDKNIPSKPVAPTSSDQARWDHTSLRRRLIQGTWEQDLEDELYRHLPADRREAWGVADMSSNALEQVSRQLAMLYHENPIVTHEQDISELVGREGYITKSGFFQLMQKVQQYTIAMRECAVRIDVVPHVKGPLPRHSGILYRVVTPDYIYAEAHPDAPDEMVYFQEYRLRFNPDNKEYEWVVDIIDIRDESNPKFGMFKIENDGSIGKDVSDIYMGHPTHEGESYPYRTKDGIPFIPVQLYRAEKTGALWNSFDSAQLTFGTLSSAVLFSFYLHLVRDACWSQKYVAGLQLAGQSAIDQDMPARRATVTTDPSSILVFTSDPDVNTQPLIGSFEPSADPQKLLESIAKYEYRVATAAGISSEVLRQSGDPRSGYALSISRDGQREAQRRYAPIFRANDEELISKTACLCNRFLGTNLPESGYRVQYAQLNLSPEEMKATREDVIQKLNAGLISPVDAIMQLNPDLDDIEAREELIRIRKERAEFL